MALAPGTRLGAYEITAAIGAGGMGEVYRAKDTKLGRDVALKVLPDAVAGDPDRIARFEREARTLAALNHPNIAHLHGFEESGAVRALVMELVEGPTLADRIAQGPIPLDEALPIAKQIAEALEAAHEQGIIHRDLKPANVKVRDNGTVKVLDFGLAKAMEPASVSSVSAMLSPTITSPAMTQAGMVLGTAAYMSPEQAKGRAADKRSDLWAFGCVLYEMLTGTRAFAGDDVSDTLANVLKSDPDWNAIPAGVGEGVRALLRRCLDKDRNRRVSDAGVVRFVVTEEESSPSAGTSRRPSLSWKRLIVMTALALLAVALGGAFLANVDRSPALPVMRFQIVLPDGLHFVGRSDVVAVSPDGQRIAYAAGTVADPDAPRQNAQLYLRSLADADAHPIPGTNLDVMAPFFSPDGQWVGFYSFQDSKLEKIPLSGGTPVPICKADPPFGVTWDNDWIVFADQGGKGILRVSPNGGEPQVLVPSGPGEVFGAPQMLDDGRAILFTVASAQRTLVDRWDQGQIVIQIIGSPARDVILRGGSEGHYVSTGHLVYMTGNTLMAVPLDRARHVRGGPVPLLRDVRRFRVIIGSPAASFGVSANGSLIYITAAPDDVTYQPRTLAFATRDGTLRPLPLPPRPYSHPRVSPDGSQRLAVETEDAKEAIIWTYDLKGGGPEAHRLTFGGHNRYPVWTPDGRRITFQSDRDGDSAMFWQLADESGPAERLTTPSTGERDIPESWSHDRKTLTFAEIPPADSRISALAIDTRSKSRPLGTDLPAQHSAFSPDGKWLAYASTEIGNRREVFVQPFPATGEKHQISTEGGTTPVWAPDQRHLYYWANLTRQFVGVEVRTEPKFDVVTKVALPIRANFHPGLFGEANYDVMPDGTFIVVTPTQDLSRGPNEPGAQAINIVLNWTEELKRRVPAR